MFSPSLRRPSLHRCVLHLVLITAACIAALPCVAQSGIRVPARPESGLDPAFARGWLAPDFDRFGFVRYEWRDAAGFAPSPRMNWSYSVGQRTSLGMSMVAPREFDYDPRPLSIFGRYWFAPDWAVSAQSASHDAPGLLRLNDLRIGVQRRF